MEERDDRTRLLIGDAALSKLKAARVAVVGLGGVGGMAAEALCRSGIGRLDLYDGDQIAPSNLNRQIMAVEENVGTGKALAAAERLRRINAETGVAAYDTFVKETNLTQLFGHLPDMIIDAIDSMTDKIALIAYAHEKGIPILSAGGAGNRIWAGRIEIKDIYQTKGDPLCRVLRRELRKRGIEKHEIAVCEYEPVKALRPPASMMFVPAQMGLVLAAAAVQQLITGEEND